MINAIIEYCAEHRGMVVVLVLALVMGGVWSMLHIPLDAIPDLSDPQVIIYTEWPGRSPNLVENQITYPIVSSMLAGPKVAAVRGLSDYGFSYVYVIFEESTDIYWARSRVLEYMSKISGKLPEGVAPQLGPDATGVGWAFEYALVDKSGRNNLAQLRSLNDWYMRYWLESVPGVAEVATIGGFVKQYQVNVDPNKLAAYNIPIDKVMEAIHSSNSEVGGRVMEFSGKEYLVRGRGYIRSIADIESLPVGTNGAGVPVSVRDVGSVVLGPDMRRGIAELNGEGEVTGGIVVVRYGQNVMEVIQRVKAKLAEVRTIPIAVVLSFIPMYATGVTSNIMSLGGIAIAIGAMVDAAIVVVEQTHKKLEHWESGGRQGSAARVIVDAVKEVGGPSFFSLLVIAVSFMPIFALQHQEWRLFKPLAFTKNFSIAIAAVLAITLDPAIRLLFMRTQGFSFRPRWLARLAGVVLVGKIHSEEKHPISRPLMYVYRPVVRFVLAYKWLVIGLAILTVVFTVPVYRRLGSEFMPPLNEGTVLYMPITQPGISVTEAEKYLQLQDKLLARVPEVESVFGKIGKSESATDPAPLSMVETTVVLKPESQWRTVHTDRWYSRRAPEFLKPPLRRIWPETRPIAWEQLTAEMDKSVQVTAFSNAWLFPIRTRIDMVTTGIRTPVGVKILGTKLETIESAGLEVERILQNVPGTRSAFFERVQGGYYVDLQVKRGEAARYGLTVGQINDVIESAIGGKTVATTVEGRERYPVNVRYARDLRDNLVKLSRVLVATPGGAQIPLTQVADISVTTGPSMIKDEQGFLAGYIYVDVAGRDIGGYVDDARRAVAAGLHLPAGYSIVWSGQYEYLRRVTERLWIVVPVTLAIVILLLYFNTGSAVKTLIILLAVPFSAVGAIWFLHFLNYNMSIAVWVGLIALLGVDAETAVFMLLYLDLAYNERKARGQMRGMADLNAAIEYGAVQRLRPKVMTVAVMFLGLVPIMWSHGAGSDVMRRIAAPMIGGIFTSFLLELMVYPAIYEIWKGFEVRKLAREPHA